jgi:hypothetical protein
MATTVQQAGFQVNPGDHLRCNLFLYDEPQLGMCGFDVVVDNIHGTPNAGDVAYGIYNAVTTAIQVLTAIPTKFLGVKVSPRELTSVRQPGIATGTDVGSDGPTPGPKQASGIIHIATDRAGPSGRGRMYVPFPSAEAPDIDGTPTIGYVNNLDTLAGAIFAGGPWDGPAGNGVDASQGVWHIEDDTFTLSFTGKGRKLFATQKRRGDFGRVNSSIIT